MENIYL